MTVVVWIFALLTAVVHITAFAWETLMFGTGVGRWPDDPRPHGGLYGAGMVRASLA